MFLAKIRGLNQDTSEESNDEEEESPVTQEALEQKIQQCYRDALVLQKQNKLSEAEKLLKELLESEILAQATGKVQYTNGKSQPLIFHLKYCCYLNLGNILYKKKNFKAALDYYIKATEIDNTDLNLWYKIGNVAMKIPNLLLAISAFMETLMRNPCHWPSLDSIIIATYAVGDHMATLLYISQALKLDAQYLTGVILKARILSEHPEWSKSFKIFYPEYDLNIGLMSNNVDAENIFQAIDKLKSKDIALCSNLYGVTSKSIPTRGLMKPLKNRSWLCLGKSLLKLYQFLYKSESETTFFSCININIIHDETNSPRESESDTISTAVEENIPMEINDDRSSKNEILGEHERNERSGDDEDDDVLTELVSVVPKSNEGEKDKDVSEGGSKSKRRKCSPTLADQLKICDKRRSARNKSMLKNNEQSLSKILKNAIPSSLLPEKDKISKNDSYDLIRWNEDSLDTMDIYRLLFEQQDQSNLPSFPGNKISEETRIKLLKDEAYFGTEKETVDIDWYIKINNGQMILELLEIYLIELASKWCYTWPSKLVDIFLEMYKILEKHGCIGKRMKLLEKWEMRTEFKESDLKSLREQLQLILLHGELLLNLRFEEPNSGEQPLGSSILGGTFSSLFLGDMKDACSLLGGPNKNPELWMRSHWLEALLFLQKKDTFAACGALAMLSYTLETEIANSNIEVKLPNLKQFHIISASGARRLLNTLDRNQCLNEVRDLFAANHYDSVSEILQKTLESDSQQLMYLPNENTLSRCQQYNLLLAALWESQKYDELFKWCEVACYEGFSLYRKSFFDEVDPSLKSDWASLVINTLSGMLSCLKNAGSLLLNVMTPEHLIRLVQTLSNLICHQIEATEPSAEITADVVTPWILLANLIDYNEKKEGINNSDDEIGEVCIFPSLSILFIAHEHLGKRSWCCFDDGALLYYTLNVVGPMFQRCLVSSDVWITLGQQVDQIFYCLYKHPYKRNKPRYVQEHDSLELALTWNRAIQAYLFYRPMKLPEFDAASKSDTITADTETLLKRMVPLVPDEQNRNRCMDSLHQFLNSSQGKIMQNVNKLQDEINDLYYLLADYYFKNKIMGKAIKYYSLDVCSNPERVDSWAAMALARGSQLEMKLNSCETIVGENEILKKAELTDKCYKKALELKYFQSSLWIEYAVFCYGIHAFCSRLLRQQTANLSLQTFGLVEMKKNEFLETSSSSFDDANKAWLEQNSMNEYVQDERWLNHYMLGKIAEKKEENLKYSLEHYSKAAEYLHQHGAEYPMRILYSSPQYYSVEALELFYRIHATVLKLLEAHEDSPLGSDNIKTIKEYLRKMDCSPFAEAKYEIKSGDNCSKSGDKNKDTVLRENCAKENTETKKTNEEVKIILDELINNVIKGSSNNESKKRKVDCFNDCGNYKRFKLKIDEGVSESQNGWSLETETDMNPLSSVEQCSEIRSKSNAISSSSLCLNSTFSKNSASESDEGTNDKSTKDEVTMTEDSEEQLFWRKEREELAKTCIEALEECIRRFPEHYKSYYRLSHHYFRSKLDRNIEKARKLLIEDTGLFSDRTSKNFFGGIWRIPTGEIDRSGSFAFHMSRSVHLLIDILRDTQDYKTLLDLSIQFKCIPDPDKKYLRDNEREEISKEALSLSAQTLRRIIDNVSLSESEEIKRKHLLGVYKCYHRVTKNFSQKDAPFGKLLTAMYYKYHSGRKDKVSTDQILTFCKSLNSMVAYQCTEESDTSKASAVKNIMLNEPSVLSTKFAAVHQSVMQKPCLPNVNITSIPNNLKHVMPSISLTALQKQDVSIQQSISEMSPLMFGLPKTLPVNRNYQNEMKFKPKMAFKQPKPIVKETEMKQNKVRNVASKTNARNGLSITPMPQRVKTSQQNASSSNKPLPKVQASTNGPSKLKVVIPDVFATRSNHSSLIITPVENKNNQPSLQEKLARTKQLADTMNGAIPSTTSKAVHKLSTSTFNEGGLPTGKSQSLGSSGISIFPLPVQNNTSSHSIKEMHKSTPIYPCSLYRPNLNNPLLSTYLTQPKSSKKSQSSDTIENSAREYMSKSKSHSDNRNIPNALDRLAKSSELEIIVKDR